MKVRKKLEITFEAVQWWSKDNLGLYNPHSGASICPGDWKIYHNNGKVEVVTDKVFREMYEVVDENTSR